MFRMSEQEIGQALRRVAERISAAANNRTADLTKICPTPRLVAVSKTKPKETVIEAYKRGQRAFGENYAQELIEKGNDEEILSKCPDIQWHMIGHLQSNKVKKIVKIPNIDVIESVDSQKLANIINKSWSALGKDTPLKVFIQVNTSKEENKSGISPEEAPSLYGYVLKQCENLQLVGLMTIGAFNYDLTQGPNPDFIELLKCREDICRIHSLSPSDVELSMGMSSDYEHAIEVGSTNVRIGSTIFGARNVK